MRLGIQRILDRTITHGDDESLFCDPAVTHTTAYQPKTR